MAVIAGSLVSANIFIQIPIYEQFSIWTIKKNNWLLGWGSPGKQHCKKGQKGPVKLIKRVKIAHSFLYSVRSVPHYHFNLAYVILQMTVKEFLKLTSKNGDIDHFNF